MDLPDPLYKANTADHGKNQEDQRNSEQDLPLHIEACFPFARRCFVLLPRALNCCLLGRSCGTYRPRLAVSVYHRVLDAVYLARRILEMVPEYRLKLRHYGAGIFETVLYASVDDWEDEAPDDEKQGL